MKTLIDRTFDRVATHGPICIGLDTAPEYLPEAFLRSYGTPAEAVFAFNKKLIDATHDLTAVYKVQIAYYEALGLAGMQAYANTLGYLRDKQAIIIADVKRGDIAKTAECYAAAHYSGDFEADYITLSPFMGKDTLEPFLDYVTNKDKGFFVLVATSNPGAADIQGLQTINHTTVSGAVAQMVQELARQTTGACGYSPVGAVVGCTNQEQTVAIRRRMANAYFLIPGYGAQGGTAQDMQHYFTASNGGVVNSSRGILQAWKQPDYAGMDFDEAARHKVIAMKEDICSAI